MQTETKRWNLVPWLCALIAIALLFSLYFPVQHVGAAAITPVSNGVGGSNTKVVFFDGNLTADSRQCVDASNFTRMDIQWIIDQNTVNTVTVKTQWSNQGQDTSSNYEDQTTLATANAADAHGGSQVLVAGQFYCVFADVTNANPLGMKVYGVLK